MNHFRKAFVLHWVHVSNTYEICYRDRHHVKGERRKGGNHDRERTEQSGSIGKTMRYIGVLQQYRTVRVSGMMTEVEQAGLGDGKTAEQEKKEGLSVLVDINSVIPK